MIIRKYFFIFMTAIIFVSGLIGLATIESIQSDDQAFPFILACALACWFMIAIHKWMNE